MSFLVFSCDIDEQIMTSVNNVSFSVREALITDPSYNVTYNCFVTENFNKEINGFEVVITSDKVYDDDNEKTLLIRNLTNGLQNGIIVDGTTYMLKYDESDGILGLL